jgi:hypothetical protein
MDDTLDAVIAKFNAIGDPFEQSFFAMVHLPYLQPFADINKRSSRLVANLPLFRANLCPLTFLDIPGQAYSCATLGVYELTRIELLRGIERALAPVPQADQTDVQALLVQELQRLHEGVLARYGLRPSELAAWKARQKLP